MIERLLQRNVPQQPDMLFLIAMF